MSGRHTSGRADPALGTRLGGARAAAGLSQVIAAQTLLVSTETVTNWENGRTEPKASQLKRLCELYRVPVAEMLGLPA